MSDQAVAVKEIDSDILQITMQDRVSKNTFSVALAEGLIDAFARIRNQDRYKVVILTGYDSYFASGGTREGLLLLSEGKGKFSDRDFYSLALNCPLPVIAAMQGHGIGGGFVLGMFADFPVLSREGVYTTNFRIRIHAGHGRHIRSSQEAGNRPRGGNDDRCRDLSR
jgi:polyketide biosynthesis enoyl-CoA hydratase PksI